MKRENLVRPMFHGRKPAAIVPPGRRLEARPLWLAAVTLAAAAAMVWAAVTLPAYF